LREFIQVPNGKMHPPYGLRGCRYGSRDFIL
jgi:hypothetical protein